MVFTFLHVIDMRGTNHWYPYLWWSKCYTVGLTPSPWRIKYKCQFIIIQQMLLLRGVDHAHCCVDPQKSGYTSITEPSECMEKKIVSLLCGLPQHIYLPKRDDDDDILTSTGRATTHCTKNWRSLFPSSMWSMLFIKPVYICKKHTGLCCFLLMLQHHPYETRSVSDLHV